MNIVIAIQKLEKQKQDIDVTLRVLRGMNENTETAKAIIYSLGPKKKNYKGKHWTQKPKNRAKMLKNLKKAKASNA